MVRPSITVLVPAHNEASTIRAAIDSIRPQLSRADRILVIADNCTDDTAAVARQAGCKVLERSDPERFGKSYALDYAIGLLEFAQDDVMIIIDADCVVHPGAIDSLGRLAHSSQRPVQGSYTLELAQGCGLAEQLSAIAFHIRNYVRPRGLQRMGMGCLLNGSGMALPALTIPTSASRASGSITEDRWLTIEFAKAGYVPLFCGEARVSGIVPAPKYMKAQATRWIHGQIECMLSGVPKLLFEAVRQRRLQNMGLMCELLIPPMSLLIALWCLVLFICATAAVLGFSAIAFLLTVSAGLLMTISVCAVLTKFYPGAMPALLPGLPAYVWTRLLVVRKFALQRQRSWVRTGREP
jgi:cellulose synthase/poly-beta-1,6-N-acetylglucosamine synthase-like glycosyltransferase